MANSKDSILGATNKSTFHGGRSLSKEDNHLPNTITGTAIINQQRNLIYADDSFAEIFGYSNAKKLTDSSWEQIYPQDEIKRIENSILPKLGDSKQHIKAKGLRKGTGKFQHAVSITKTCDNKVVLRASRTLGNSDEDYVAKQGNTKITRLRQGLSKLEKCSTDGDIYKTTLHIVQDVTCYDFCALQLKEDNLLIATSPPNGKGLSRIGEGLSNLTLKKGEVIQGENLTEYSDFEPNVTQFQSFVSVPIEEFGTLQVFSTSKNNFTEFDVDLLQILGNHLRERLSRSKLEGELREKAIHDELTGLYNRHYLNEVLVKEVERADRYNHNLSFLMIDVNRFKDVNDSYSHAMGDQVLAELGNVIEANVREPDTVFRYGGDEFLILLPETGKDSEVVARRLRNEMQKWNEKNDLIDFPLSLAMGTSQFNPDKDITVDDTINKADRKMYEDKDSCKKE